MGGNGKAKNDVKLTKKDGNESNSKNVKLSGKRLVTANATADVQETRPISKDGQEIHASWTGKFPLALLHEHCQKQGWGKVIYDIRRLQGGFVATVTLSYINPKTKEAEKIIMKPDLETLQPQETNILAKNYSATYALFRVASQKSIHLALPPTYRSFWMQLTSIKKVDIAKNKDWLYAADPFAAKRAQEAAKQKSIAGKESKDKEIKEPKRLSPSWSYAPIAEMSESLRKEVEQVVREFHWTPQCHKWSESSRCQLAEGLSKLGFHKSHCEESLDWSSSRAEAIEWLLIHVPEDDLPPAFQPPDYLATSISFLNLQDDRLKIEYAIKRLSRNGFSKDLCLKTLEQCNKNEMLAAERLLLDLIYEGESVEFPNSAENDTMWSEERDVLAATYGEAFKLLNDDSYEICINMNDKLVKILRIVFSKPVSKEYPNTIPMIEVNATPELPSYLKLQVLKEIGKYAVSLTGDLMIYDIVEWIRLNIHETISNPGKLRDISISVAGFSERNAPISNKPQLRVPTKPQGSLERGKFILQKWIECEKKPEYDNILQSRKRLPAWKHKDSIVNAIERDQVVIISGETGSGKSTQSVQFILDHMIRSGRGAVCNMICTQPRRISAIGLADRVSYERLSEIGKLIGYSVRGDSKIERDTLMQYVTTGVLLRRMQSGNLDEISHIFIDEVHERSLDTDVLLALLKHTLVTNKRLKVILMSATVDADAFLQYFGRGEHIHIEGRTFPIEDIYLDGILERTGYRIGESDEEAINTIRSIGSKTNYPLLSAIVSYIDKRLGEGSILIFLSGIAEINHCIRAISEGNQQYYILPLHASLSPAEQKRVFHAAPKGKRKVICATNVAETSITIDDVIAVIDTGKVKAVAYDAISQISKLTEQWNSHASSKQRRGRAGRTQRGICIKMFTEALESKMPERQEPEILRTPLEQVCLSVKSMGILDPGSFLRGCMSPPKLVSIGKAIEVLHSMGAVSNNQLTSLGRHMALIPADLRCAKLIIISALFGCSQASLTLASLLSCRSPFYSGNDREAAQLSRMSFTEGAGDILTDMKAYESWIRQGAGANRAWCNDNHMSVQTLLEIRSTRQQYEEVLATTGFECIDEVSSDKLTLLSAMLVAGLAPNAAKIVFPEKKYISHSSGTIEKDVEARVIKYYTRVNSRIFLHPSSTLFAENNYRDAAFLVFFTKMETSKVFAQQVTPANLYAMLFFGGKLEIDPEGRGLLIDTFKVRAWSRIGVLVNRLRRILDELLAQKIDQPRLDISSHPAVLVVKKLLLTNGKQVI